MTAFVYKGFFNKINLLLHVYRILNQQNDMQEKPHFIFICLIEYILWEVTKLGKKETQSQILL